jgi:hypothetical protein
MAQLQQAKITAQSNLQAKIEASNARKAQDALEREKFNLMKGNQKLDKKAGEAKLKSSMALSKEYRSAPTTKATNVMRSSIKKMEKAPNP